MSTNVIIPISVKNYFLMEHKIQVLQSELNYKKECYKNCPHPYTLFEIMDIKKQIDQTLKNKQKIKIFKKVIVKKYTQIN